MRGHETNSGSLQISGPQIGGNHYLHHIAYLAHVITNAHSTGVVPTSLAFQHLTNGIFSKREREKGGIKNDGVSSGAQTSPQLRVFSMAEVHVEPSMPPAQHRILCVDPENFC
jgi:hypothetical protein